MQRVKEVRQSQFAALDAPRYQPPQTFIPDFDVNRYLRAQNDFRLQRPVQQTMPKKDLSSLFAPKVTRKPYTMTRYQNTAYSANSGSEDVVQYLATQRQLLLKA